MNTLLTNKNGALVRKRLTELISLSGELKVLGIPFSRQDLRILMFSGSVS